MTTRQKTRRDLQRALRSTFKDTEEWRRVDHWWGFEYRHVAHGGRQWVVRGVWPKLAIAVLLFAAALGAVIGALAW